MDKLSLKIQENLRRLCEQHEKYMQEAMTVYTNSLKEHQRLFDEEYSRSMGRIEAAVQSALGDQDTIEKTSDENQKMDLGETDAT